MGLHRNEQTQSRLLLSEQSRVKGSVESEGCGRQTCDPDKNKVESSAVGNDLGKGENNKTGLKQLRLGNLSLSEIHQFM